MSVNPITSDKEQYSSLLGRAAHRPGKVSQQFALGTSKEDITNLHRAQDRMTTMLATVDRIARLHNISYWMCGGSLIGAMREGGWVPWDHDIDIGMKDEDFRRFQHFARTELGEGMWLQDEDSDPHFLSNNTKAYVRDLHFSYGDGTCQPEQWLNGLQVDIFLSGGNTGCGGFGYSATCCDPSLVLPTVDVPFGTHRFAAPLKWEFALQEEYGADWVKQPPVANRTVPQFTNVTCDWQKVMYPDLYAQATASLETTVPEVVLIPVVFVAAWLAVTSLSANGLTPLKLTSSEWMYVLLFIGLSAASTLALRQTNGSKVQMTIEACVLLYALKAAASLGLLVFKQSMSFAAIAEGLSKKDANMGLPVWCHLALTGSLFAAYDALSFGATQHMAPMSFQLLLNSRTLLLVPLQYGVFGKKVTHWQFCALLIMGIGISTLAAGDMMSLRTAAHAKERHDYIVAVVLIFGKVVVSAVALIMNEKTLKEMPLTIDAQNGIMYCFGMVPLVVAVIVGSSTETDHQGMASILGQIFSSSWMLLAVACMTSLGIVCAYLLKAFSAMEKEIMSGGVVALLAIGQWWTPGEAEVTLLSLECATIIVAGCLLYRLNEPMVDQK